MILTYSEFQDITEFPDSNSPKKYKKHYKESEETYFNDLIGRELVAKIKDGEYSELMELSKLCLAYYIELAFLKTGNITIISEGGIQRQGDYKKAPEYIDKENRIKHSYKVLRSYEEQLVSKIRDGDYPEWNENKKISTKETFSITAIG